MRPRRGAADQSISADNTAQDTTVITGVTNPRRRSEPSNWSPYTAGTPYGVFARRGQNPLRYFTSEQLRELTLTDPLGLVRDLPDLHPTVSHALNNARNLMFSATDDIKITAETAGADGELSSDASEAEINEADTSSVRAFWKQLPPEVGGGLRGFSSILGDELQLTGMICVETCPGQPLEGLKRAWIINSLTVELSRVNRDADLAMFQRLRYPQAAPENPSMPKMQSYDMYNYGWEELPSETCFWAAIGQMSDIVHGRAAYATATVEAIADMALIQDLRDAVHNAAWPRHDIGVNLAKLHQVAVEVYKITDPKRAAQWVNQRYQEIVDYVATLRSDDNVVHDSNGQVNMLQPGSFQGLEGVLSFLRQRLAQSLKTLPTLLGINDGSTFNYTSVEWAVYAQNLEATRAVVFEIIQKISELHLRLIGSKSIVRITAAPIRTNDEQQDANTESTQIGNEIQKEKAGYITHDQGAMKITGKKAAGPAQPGVIEPLPSDTGFTGPGQTNSNTRTGGDGGTRNSGKPGPKKIPQNPNSEGTTEEERNSAAK